MRTSLLDQAILFYSNHHIRFFFWGGQFATEWTLLLHPGQATTYDGISAFTSSESHLWCISSALNVNNLNMKIILILYFLEVLYI